MIKLNLNYDPLKKSYKLIISNNNGAYLAGVDVHEELEIHKAMGVIEAMTDAWTLTKTHKQLYVHAYEDLEKKVLASEQKYRAARADYKQLLDDHHELLGIMKHKV